MQDEYLSKLSEHVRGLVEEVEQTSGVPQYASGETGAGRVS
ncbi:hypothetical protein LMG18101_05007 [Ralstonia flaminis]|jgi:hypothetical protein|uniref:Uncharacterized protein n=1 Tax=Ralstonia flaminis TaxID=3058597 RepID=A0ABN9JRY7_9RALS|nr:hypothetical protein LMG18101_05007 [Ralstonia sp. LMG 18101]